MSIRIEGGGGSKENIFSDSESGIPLWNGEPLLNLVYPVGSIYWSSNDTDPGTLFGGTWQQIKDRFVLAAGDSYSVNATGGEKAHTLAKEEMPSHDHSFTPSGSVSSSFSGNTGTVNVSGGNHRHYIPTPRDNGDESTFSMSTNNKPYLLNNSYTDYSGNLSMSGSFTPSGSVSSTFTGTSGTTGSRGSGTAHNNMPPYIVKYCWERIA